MVERLFHNQRVPGSNPGEGGFYFSHFLGHGAQSSEQKGSFSGLELVPGIPGTEIRVVSVSMLLKSREILPGYMLLPIKKIKHVSFVKVKRKESTLYNLSSG